MAAAVCASHAVHRGKAVTHVIDLAHGESRPRLTLVVESGTDSRLVDALAEHSDLTVLARAIPDGREISQGSSARMIFQRLPASRLRFAAAVMSHVLRARNSRRVVLSQGYGIGSLAANLAGRLVGARVIMLVCSPQEDYYAARRLDPGGLRFRRSEYVAIRLLARANALLGYRYVVLSEYLAQVVRRHGERVACDIVPVYGVDPEVFKPSGRDKLALRRERGLPQRGRLIFHSSRIAPEKDTDTLLAAFRELIARGYDVHLLHRSGGHPALIERARAAGVADRVIATDAVDPRRDLPFDYAAADVCVQPSRAEGLGFSVLEALACETPVVATAVGGLLETVNGRTGWTVPPGDPHAFADAIADVLDRPDEALRRARAGRAMVLERFARANVFARLISIIEHV